MAFPVFLVFRGKCDFLNMALISLIAFRRWGRRGTSRRRRASSQAIRRSATRAPDLSFAKHAAAPPLIEAQEQRLRQTAAGHQHRIQKGLVEAGHLGWGEA